MVSVEDQNESLESIYLISNKRKKSQGRNVFGSLCLWVYSMYSKTGKLSIVDNQQTEVLTVRHIQEYSINTGKYPRLLHGVT